MSTILQEKKVQIKNQSEYAKEVLEFVDILRFKSGKYRKVSNVYGNTGKGRCALGVYLSEKYGWSGRNPGEPDNKLSNISESLFYDIIPYLNDKETVTKVYGVWTDVEGYNWSWDRIADELERGVAPL